MYFKHTTTTATIMKNGIPRRISLALLAGSMMPLVAHAFIDERTPAPPPAPAPAQIAPTIIEPKLIVPLAKPAPAAEQAVVPGVTTTTQALQAGVTGDITAAAWNGAYPGPFGSMPLADALIAQVVPVVGTAIQLDGSPDLFGSTVVVPQGASRLATLKAVADGHGLTIDIKGNLVKVAKAKPAINITTTTVPAAADGAASQTAVATVQAQAEPLPPPEPVMSWHLPKGMMLSTAMLEWAEKWGWELIWRAEVDYRIAADITLHETFLDGVGKVLEAYRTGNRPLWGDWNDQQKVLVIREPTNRDN